LHYHRRHPCTNTGSTGRWNSFTGNSGGWDQVAFDLSAYAGKQVEVSITYVSDPGTGGNGLFIDDTGRPPRPVRATPRTPCCSASARSRPAPRPTAGSCSTGR
jgi:hypothetical protein